MNKYEAIQRRAELEKQIEDSFNTWMSKPETKLVLSLIPASDVPDAVRVLLLSAFKCGCDLGAFQMCTQFVDAVVKAQKE